MFGSSKEVQRAILWSLVWARIAFASAWDDSGAWPSEDAYTFSSLGSYATVTNLSAMQHEETWTFETGTNITITVTDFTAMTHTISNTWEEAVDGVTNAYTNAKTYAYHGPVTLTNDLVRTIESEYYTALEADVPTEERSSWSTNWPLISTNIVVLDDAYGAATVTVTLAHSITGVAIDWDLDALDMMGFDSYMACRERWQVLQDAARTPHQNEAFRPRFYRSARDNLVAAKSWVYDVHTNFADVFLGDTNAQDFADYLATPLTPGSNDYPTTIPVMVWTNLCASNSVPTNWPAFTPYWNLNGAIPGHGHLVTQTWEVIGIATNPSQVVTNDVETFNGVTNSIVGTNGQAVSIISTNANVIEGFVESDYTFKHVDEMLNVLICIPADASPNADNYTNANSHGIFHGEGWSWTGIPTSEGSPSDCAGEGVQSNWAHHADSLAWPEYLIDFGGAPTGWSGLEGSNFSVTLSCYSISACSDSSEEPILSSIISDYRNSWNYAYTIEDHGEVEGSLDFGPGTLLSTYSPSAVCGETSRAIVGTRQCDDAAEGFTNARTFYASASAAMYGLQLDHPEGLYCEETTATSVVDDVTYENPWSEQSRIAVDILIEGPTNAAQASVINLYALGGGFPDTLGPINGTTEQSDFENWEIAGTPVFSQWEVNTTNYVPVVTATVTGRYYCTDFYGTNTLIPGHRNFFQKGADIENGIADRWYNLDGGFAYR